MLSAVIPIFEAAATLPEVLAALAGGVDEIVVADGGSRDNGVALARGAGCRVVLARRRGRGSQLATGVAAARGEWLLLWHADTLPGAGWQEAMAKAMAEPAYAYYFRFALASSDPPARRIERLVAWRCRFLALPYGDQGLLIARSLFEAVGGIRDLPLMEDVDLVRRLGRRRLAPLAATALTSARRYERDGYWLRPARNLLCLGLWYFGLPAEIVARLYRGRSMS